MGRVGHLRWKCPTFPIHSDRISIQIYGQKTDLKVLNIFSIETYQIFPAMLFLIELDWIFILKMWIRILDSMFDSI